MSTGLIKLEPEFKQKWIEALRSGQYKKGVGFLYRFSNKTYCCLGVACSISGYKNEDISQRLLITDDFDVPEILKEGTSPKVNLEGVSIDQTLDNFLARMNDDGKSFNEIADWIEENL